MKNIVKVLSVLLVFALTVVSLAGCGKSKDRILYANVNLEKYVKLCDYKNIEIDTSSSDFKESYENLVKKDAEEKGLAAKLTEGKVQNGDVANIDYCGKKDGVAFEGGTAEGYDLEIGSHSFIDGFEDGLIGVAIGDTVDLDLTFPEGYQSEELAGKAVVFTVKVNYVKRNKTAEEIYADMGFESFAAYDSNLKIRAADEYNLKYITDNSEVTDYPKDDIDLVYKVQLASIKNTLKTQYNMELSEYLQYSNMTEDAFKESFIQSSIKSTMKEQMVIYAIADKENIEIDKDELDKWSKEYLKKLGSTSSVESVKEGYGDYYFEELFLKEKVLDLIAMNVNIK